MFSKMLTIRQIQHLNATLTSVFIGFDENLKRPAESTRARGSQAPKCRHVDDNTENFQKIRQAFPDLFLENSNKNAPKQNHQQWEVYRDLYELQATLNEDKIRERA